MGGRGEDCEVGRPGESIIQCGEAVNVEFIAECCAPLRVWFDDSQGGHAELLQISQMAAADRATTYDEGLHLRLPDFAGWNSERRMPIQRRSLYSPPWKRSCRRRPSTPQDALSPIRMPNVALR